MGRDIHRRVALTLMLGLVGLVACKSPYLAGGRLHFAQGRYERALEQFQKAKAEQPQNGEVRLELGRALAELDRAEEAAAEFQNAVELDPGPEMAENVANSRQHYFGRKQEQALSLTKQGYTARDEGDTTRARELFVSAIEEFEKAALYNPREESAFTNIGKLYYELGRTDEAIAMFEKVKEMAQDRSASAEDPEKARKVLEQVDDLLVAVYWDLGDRAYRREDWDTAVRFYERVSELKPGDSSIHYQLAGSYFQKALSVSPDKKTEYLEMAAQHYGKVVETVSTDEDALYNMTVTYWELGQYERALQPAKNLVDLNPREGDYWILQGRIYGKVERADDFVTAFIIGKALRDGRPSPPGVDVRDQVQQYGPGTDILNTLRTMGLPQDIRSFNDSSGEEYVCWFYWSEGKAYAFLDGAKKYEAEFQPVTSGS